MCLLCSGVYEGASDPSILIHPTELFLLRLVHVLGAVVVCWTLNRFLVAIILWCVRRVSRGRRQLGQKEWLIINVQVFGE